MSDTPDITLNPDQQAVTLKTLKDIQHAMATLAGQVQRHNGTLNAELAQNVLCVTEYSLADLSKLLGIASQTAQDIEKRHAALRQANQRIHELERQLGAAQAPDMTQASLKNLAERVEAWWRQEGFGHISSVHFDKYGCEIDFCCSLFGDFYVVDSPTPVSDKERYRLWLAHLAERGFVLTDEDGDDALQDCDQNREVLTALFAHRLPSARLRSVENHARRGKDFVLRGVKVYVRQLADILSLPVPETSSDN